MSLTRAGYPYSRPTAGGSLSRPGQSCGSAKWQYRRETAYPESAAVTPEDVAGGRTMSDDALTRKSETAARFNRMASDFDPQGAFAHFGQRLVDVVGIEPGQRVLDVATGRGAVLFAAAERVGAAGKAIGIDLAE